MEQHYKLDRVRELADNDADFIKSLAEAFLDEVPEDAERLKKAVSEQDFFNTYQAAHKMKPTIDLFELGVLQDLIVVQDWGKFERVGEDCSTELQHVLTAVENATAELKQDFSL
ncbi:Hpt domain-containing protein [uncultured Psychroserpens sp.]|uniref:Hpt domain-containing protein n=1 Tax=uncultured Psychroserpens sp. TaxID=255436 RepID=UPI00261D3397|nr:Hpt domain-containing protein [uncultured Psychroserpens sp.]